MLAEYFLDVDISSHRCWTKIFVAHQDDDVDGRLRSEMVEGLGLYGGEVGGRCVSCVDEITF